MRSAEQHEESLSDIFALKPSIDAEFEVRARKHPKDELRLQEALVKHHEAQLEQARERVEWLKERA